MVSDGDPVQWAKSASAKAGDAKRELTDPQQIKLAESIEHLAWAFALFAQRMEDRLQ